jgi:hypothetical protein
MRSSDFYLTERIMNQRVQAEHRQASASRLSRQVVRAARLHGAQPGNWLAWQGRWMLCELGYRLVALGARLEATSLP